MQFNTRANIPCEGELGKKVKIGKISGSLLFSPLPYHSPFKADDTNVQTDLHGANLGFIFASPKQNMHFLCLRDLNSIHFGSESAVSSHGLAPTCLT